MLVLLQSRVIVLRLLSERVLEALRRLSGRVPAEVGEVEGALFDLCGKILDPLCELGVEGLNLCDAG